MQYVVYNGWVNRLAAHKPGSDEWNKVWADLWRSGGSGSTCGRINKDARKLYEERRRYIEAAERMIHRPWVVVDESSYVKPVDLRPGKMNWVDEVADWPLEYKHDLMRYGRSPAMSAMPDIDMVHSLHRTLFNNNEGEKQMDKKIDWRKPLRAINPVFGTVQKEEVYTYKSGSQRVIWVDERVYPVDDNGRVVATVQYPGKGFRTPGQKIVENVPEEKFFLGLYRNSDGTYWLTDFGQMTTMEVLNRWKSTFAPHEPHWIVDIRKSAEPPKATEHDPKDWTTIAISGDATLSNGMMTKGTAERSAARFGDQVVRVRTTPAPVDTSRYIQLWRESETRPWRINAHGPAAGGSQEFTWDETKHRGANPLQTAVKVRD